MSWGALAPTKQHISKIWKRIVVYSDMHSITCRNTFSNTSLLQINNLTQPRAIFYENDKKIVCMSYVSPNITFLSVVCN